MLRKTLLGILVGTALTLGSPATASTQYDTVMITPDVTIDTPRIFLSDLFHGLDPAQDRDIANAPAPGQSVLFDARLLMRVAQAYKIEWLPSSGRDQVVVRRDAMTLHLDDVLPLVEEALSVWSLGDKLDINLAGDVDRLLLPADTQLDTLSVEGLRIEERSGRFAATLTYFDGQGRAVRHPIGGRAFRLVEVPVLAARAHSGDVVTASDISWRTIRADKVGRSVVLDPSRLIGMTPRRTLPANQPVRVNDVTVPLLVERGDLVTLTIKTNRMHLTARGKALANAAQGEVVRVMNTTSNRIVEGIAVAPGIVLVTVSTPQVGTIQTAAR